MEKSDSKTSPSSLIVGSQKELSIKSSDQGVADRMVVELLDLARRYSTKNYRKKVRLGSVDLCEPDYAQIVNWAKRLGYEPASLITYIMSFRDPEGNMSRLVDGALSELVWNGELPLERFNWEDGLQIEKLTITNRMPSEYAKDQLLSLKRLNAVGLDLSEIDLSPFPNLETLRCAENLLSQLNLASIPNLIYLDCSTNEIYELDLSKVPNLKVLDCASNMLEQLSIKSVPLLEEVCCSRNQIFDLDAAENLSLVSLDCEWNYIENLRLPLHGRLKQLVCGTNSLQTLDLSSCDNLESLWCQRNNFNEINIGPCQSLRELRFYPDQVKSLQLTGLWEIARNWSKESGLSRLEIAVDNSEGLMNKGYWWTGGPLSYSEVCLCVLHEMKIVYEWE